MSDCTPRTHVLWERGGTKAEAAARALRAYCHNVLERPSELRFRRVRECGTAFTSLILGCHGALEVLKLCGFERTEGFPDGTYYVLRRVDANLLSEVRNELDLGLKAISLARQAKAAACRFEADGVGGTFSSCAIGADAGSVDTSASCAAGADAGSRSSDLSHGSDYNLRRQLQARSLRSGRL